MKTAYRVAYFAVTALAFSGCASPKLTQKAERDAKLGVMPSQRLVEEGQPVPKGGGVYRVGKSYTIAGRTYTPHENAAAHSQVGVASWYGKQFHGRLTANGEIYDMHGISAAHRTMPMPSYARVTNVSNGRSIIVRVNDRGPYHGNRVIDLSSRAANLLDMTRAGLGRVKVEYAGRAELDGSDDKKLAATLRMDGLPAQLPGTSVMMASVPAAKPFVPKVETTSPLVANEDVLNEPVKQSLPMSAPLPASRPAAVAVVAAPALRPSLPVVAAAAPASDSDELPATAAAFAAPARSAPSVVVPSPLRKPMLKPAGATALGAIY